jgi:hypothetical protein
MPVLLSPEPAAGAERQVMITVHHAENSRSQHIHARHALDKGGRCELLR